MPFILKVAINNNTSVHLGDQFNQLKIFGSDYSTQDGTCERDFIHVVDLANGHLAALQKINQLSGYHVFNLGTGKPISVLEMVSTFQKVNQVSVPYQLIERRPGDLEVCFCDPQHTKDILKWETQKTLEDMCVDAWKFQKLNPQGF